MREAVILGTCVVLSIVLHALFVVEGFGESDAARLATLATEWHQTGSIHSYSYPLRTSPLYIHSIKILLGLGIPLHNVPPLMNWLSLILASLTLIPLYLLWRLLSRPLVSIFACLLFFVTPAFWLANIYGMAHLPSFSLFITSLLLFARGLKRPSTSAFAWSTGAAVLVVLSVALKADIILCFGAYLGITICGNDLNKRSIVLSLLIPVVALSFVIMYTNSITSTIPSLGNSAGIWATSFPFTIEAVMDRSNRMVPVRTVGILLFAACVLSVVYCAVRRRHLKLLVFCLIWACPLILFWGLKMGNSARHMMAGFCPLLFLTALAAHDWIKNPRILWLSLAVILAGNYFIDVGDNPGTTSPPPQLHRLKKMVTNYAKKRHILSRRFAEIDDVKQKIYAGNTTTPYVEWEVFASAKSFRVWQPDPRIYEVVTKNNLSHLFALQQVASSDTVRGSLNWLVWTFEPGVTMRQHNKWMKYLTDKNFEFKPPD